MRLLGDRFGGVCEAQSGEVWPGHRIAEEAASRARRLRALGVGRGDRVMICHGGSAAFFADLFAVWQAGGCAICVNPGLSAEQLDALAGFADPVVALSGSGRTTPQIGRLPTMDLGDAAPAGDPGGEDSGAELDDEALILFTSGTTGQPKGVVHTFRSLLARVALNQAAIPAQERSVVLCPLPTHFGHGLIGNALTALLDGGELVLMPDPDIRSLAGLSEVIDRHKVTFMSSVPTFWKLALKIARRPEAGTLRRVHVGSAPLSADLWLQIADWCGTRNVWNMYGITETANWIGGACAADGAPVDGGIGRVWGGQAAVRTADGDIRAHGVGEILVQSPSLMKGYLKRPDLTQEALRDGWFCTGDVGSIDADGQVRLTGRLKHEINRAGMKVHPEDIDLLLERSDMVREACSFGLPDDLAGEIVAVAVVAADGADFDLEALKAWTASRLAREQVPERWFILDDLPKSDRGKINRADIADMCADIGSNPSPVR